MLIDGGVGTTYTGAAIAGLPAHTRPASFYPQNTMIYAQGDAVGGLHVVEYGTVRICSLTADGRRQVHAFHFAGEVFGFEPAAERRFSAESVNGAGVRQLATDGQTDPRHLLALALDSLDAAQAHQLLLWRRGATEKMVSFILDMMERQDADRIVGLPMQRNDIADYLGLTFETVSRALRALKELKIVRLPAVHQIEVLDRDALATLAS